jgi:phage shock protein PspC (stress-responsive transcriptional regulator)
MAGAPSTASQPTTPLSRARSGRWLAGVCSGVARQRGLPVGSLRAAFAIAVLFGGLGVLVYVACWLIIPAEGDADADDTPRGVVVLAQALAACAGLATLVALASAATVFGFGWAVVAVAAAILLAALASWPRIGPGWVLLPVAALALPAVAMAVGGVRLAPRTGLVYAAPRTVAAVPRDGYRGGLGAMFLDLRRMVLPATGSVAVHIDGGLRRTIVALPADRCVHVELRYDVVPFLARLSDLLAGRSPYGAVVFFGQQQYGDSGAFSNLAARAPGPTLAIDFHSEGGSLYVRDYPDTVNPQAEPDWPGYRVFVEPPPSLIGIPRAAAQRIVRAWRARRQVDVRSARLIDRLLPGPCATPRGAKR